MDHLFHGNRMSFIADQRFVNNRRYLCSVNNSAVRHPDEMLDDEFDPFFNDETLEDIDTSLSAPPQTQ